MMQQIVPAAKVSILLMKNKKQDNKKRTGRAKRRIAREGR